MGLIGEAVQELETAIEGSGCEDGAVVLRRSPDEILCQYEQGVCLEALYGGRSGEFVTSNPVEAVTKVSFLFDATLTNNTAKSAACAVLNVLSAFLCISRKVRACPSSAHPACLAELGEYLSDKRVFLAGVCPILARELGAGITQDPALADVLIINNEGVLSEEVAGIVALYRDRKKIICIGPSTAGVAGLTRIERFCPYGT